MDNKTKIIVGMTLVMMILIYKVGQSERDTNFVNSTVDAAKETITQPLTEPVVQAATPDIKAPEIITALNNENYPEVSDNAVRIRIIPNSNSYDDQQAKMMVTYAIDEYMSEHQSELTSLEATRMFVATHIEELKAEVSKVLEAISYDEKFEITYGAHLFPEKELNDKVYAEGYYESLVIKLGNGEGSNWWCFMNTQLCLGPAANTEDDEFWNAQYEATKTAKEEMATRDIQFFIADVVDALFGEDEPTVVEAKNRVEKWYLYEDEY